MTTEELEQNMNNVFNEEAIEYKKPLVIYHKNCADGFSGAWVFHYMEEKIGQTFDYHPSLYNDPVPDVEDRIVYLVDFSYKRAVVEEILAKATHVYVIDHHKTAIEDLFMLESVHKNLTMYVDVNRSGAMLAWDFWHNTVWSSGDFKTRVVLEKEIKNTDVTYTPPPLMLGYVQDRDLWQFKLADSHAVSAFIFSHKYSFKEWDKLMTGGETTILNARSAGAGILKKQNKDMEEFTAASIQFWEVLGYIIPVVNAPYMWGSDMAHNLLKQYPDAPFAGYYWIGTEGTMNWGLRSEDSRVDASEIAKQFGGGGHRNACGFKVDAESAFHFSGYDKLRMYNKEKEA